jgi:hypothetical protein
MDLIGLRWSRRYAGHAIRLHNPRETMSIGFRDAFLL